MRLSISCLVLAAASLAAGAPQPHQAQAPASPSPAASPAEEGHQQITRPVCASNATRQCCISVRALTKELLDPLGTVLPLLGGVKIGSIVGIGCQPMAEDAPDQTCRNSVACCSGETLAGPGTLTLGCKDLPQA
ncbi:hypothetical protein VTN02DRAFT_4133 [Thermoascus thermophilus]